MAWCFLSSTRRYGNGIIGLSLLYVVVSNYLPTLNSNGASTPTGIPAYLGWLLRAGAGHNCNSGQGIVP